MAPGRACRAHRVTASQVIANPFVQFGASLSTLPKVAKVAGLVTQSGWVDPYRCLQLDRWRVGLIFLSARDGEAHSEGASPLSRGVSVAWRVPPGNLWRYGGSMAPTPPARLKAWVELAEAEMWVYDETADGHPRLTPPPGLTDPYRPGRPASPVVLSKTPSDGRADVNAACVLRRLGVPIPHKGRSHKKKGM